MNKKFDKDLKYGQERENRIVSILDKDKTKMEVKTERDWWFKTNNIAIEVECHGKPSGIKATESDYWFHNLCIDDEEYCTLVFKTETLKKIVDKIDKFKSVSGGDHNASKMILISLQKLFSAEIIQAFKELDNEEES